VNSRRPGRPPASNLLWTVVDVAGQTGVTVARARAVVIGAGIGGLAAAAGLCSAGWDVTAFERATSLEPVGAGLALAPNGLRALDVISAGNPLRALAVPQELGIRRSRPTSLSISRRPRRDETPYGVGICLLRLRAAIVGRPRIVASFGGPGWQHRPWPPHGTGSPCSSLGTESARSKPQPLPRPLPPGGMTFCV
jgi:NADPH-dependent 2,4-dienoyl-CoA reductase/sulfur reductase-like enzyme